MARPRDIVFQRAARRAAPSNFCSGALFRASLAALLLSTLSACASLPPTPAGRGLYVDARKALLGESRLGWTVDRVEIEQAAAEVEPSACRVEPAERAALRRWVASRIAASGGPAETQYRAGRDIDDLDDVLELERIALLLDKVELYMPGDCPFWVEPEPDFEGEHSTMRRFVLIGESMGGASLLFTRGTTRYGGGGAARLLLSYGFSPHLQLALGGEAGGDAILEENADGQLSPAGGFRFGWPAWLRFIDVDRIYDIELAAVTRLDQGRLSPWGGRVALAGGVTGLRRLGFMPALQVWLGYELYPAQDGLPAQHALRLGTRVGFDWDP
jgi:hypothetical protein